MDLAADHGLGVGDGNARRGAAVLHVSDGHDLDRLSGARGGSPGLPAAQALEARTTLPRPDGAPSAVGEIQPAGGVADSTAAIGEAVQVDGGTVVVLHGPVDVRPPL